MAEWSGYLSDAELDAVHRATIDAGLAATDGRLDALMSGVNQRFVSHLGGGGLPPSMRLLVQLQEMNRVHNLRSGEVPLGQWLHSAVTLAGDRKEADVFESALDRLSQAPSVPVAPTLGLEAAPTLASANLELQPEAMIAGSDQTVGVSFLAGGLETSRAVVKLLVHRHEDGEAVFQDGDEPWLVNGTGWFIAPGLVITNHHVINARNQSFVVEPSASADDFRLQAENTHVQYDYLEKGSDPASISTGPGALEAADEALDFAILRLPDGSESRGPLPLRTRPIRKRLEQALGTRVNLLQHPNGDPMRLGFRDNFVVSGNESELSYLTDTNLGSSGSPVCDDRWSVAALHSGSRNISSQDLEIRGRKVRRENFGIPMPRIVAHLKQHHLDLHNEIQSAQA